MLQSKNLKTAQSLQLEKQKPHQPDLKDNIPARALLKETSTPSYLGGAKTTIADNIVNTAWDGFAESRQRDPSAFRTPSPFTQGPGDHNHSTGTIGLSSKEHQRKRIREGSISIGAKRFCHISPDMKDHGKYHRSIETVGEDAQYDVYRGSPSPQGREPTADELDHSVIILDNDDELDELVETSSQNWRDISKKKGPPSLNPDYLLIDLDDKEDELFEEIEMLAHRKSPSPGRSGTIIESRNPPITPPWVVQESFQREGEIFKIGDFVELKISGFLRISVILVNLQCDDVKFRGCRLERTRALNGILPKKLNELYWNIEIELDDPRHPMVQGMEEVDLGQVLTVRMTRVTNQLFPSCSFRETGGYNNEGPAELNAPCAVRWKYSCKYLTGRDRWHNRWNERSVEHLKAENLSQEDRLALVVSDAKIRNRYRGDTIPGGAYPGIEKTETAKPSVTEKIHESSEKPVVIVIDDEPEVEQLRRSVSVIQMSDKGKKVYSSNQEVQEVPDRWLQQILLPSSDNIIDLSNSELAAPPHEGFIAMQNVRTSEFVAPKHIARVPGQKYTYGDCCKLYSYSSSWGSY